MTLYTFLAGIAIGLYVGHILTMGYMPCPKCSVCITAEVIR